MGLRRLLISEKYLSYRIKLGVREVISFCERGYATRQVMRAVLLFYPILMLLLSTSNYSCSMFMRGAAM